jgi:hypothetical protein
VKPVLQALVLAERVYEDRSGKKIIAGTFNRVKFSTRPLVREIENPDGTKRTIVPGGMHGGSPYAYMSLTDVCDGTTLHLHFVNLTKNEVLFANAVCISNSDRLATIELVVALPPLPIKTEGTYAFEVVCDEEILGSCRIQAEELTFPDREQ